MELYIRKYSGDLTVILSNKGEVVGMYDSMAEAKDAYLDYLNSIDATSYDDFIFNYAA